MKIHKDIHNIDLKNNIYFMAHFNVERECCECLYTSNKNMPKGYQRRLYIGWISVGAYRILQKHFADNYPKSFRMTDIYQLHFPEPYIESEQVPLNKIEKLQKEREAKIFRMGVV